MEKEEPTKIIPTVQEHPIASVREADKGEESKGGLHDADEGARRFVPPQKID